MNLLRKLIAGDDIRPTRLHTQAGNFVGISNLGGLVPGGWSWARQKLTGNHMQVPWWTWRAIRYIDGALRPDDRLLEVGSGFSSLWLAKRVKRIVTIEDHPFWSQRVREAAQREGLSNLELVVGNSYEEFERRIGMDEYSVVVLDGPERRLDMFKLMLRLAPERRPRLVIYDDTDFVENQAALALSMGNGKWHTFPGFKAQSVHACETSVYVLGEGQDA